MSVVARAAQVASAAAKGTGLGAFDPVNTGAREPEHTFHQPVPITGRIVWADDGEEHLETVALGWTGRDVYVPMTDRRYQLRAVWLDAAAVRRR
jgi:hypothetical protein